MRPEVSSKVSVTKNPSVPCMCSQKWKASLPSQPPARHLQGYSNSCALVSSDLRIQSLSIAPVTLCLLNSSSLARIGLVTSICTQKKQRQRRHRKAYFLH